MKRKLAYIPVAALLVALDQWLKQLAYAHRHSLLNGTARGFVLPGIIHTTYTENTGMALGLLKNARWFFVALTIPILAWAVWLIVKGKLRSVTGEWLLVVVIAGTIGNYIDRLLRGYVVDYLTFDIVLDFFVFNLADVFLTVGGAALCVVVAIRHPAFKKDAPEPDDVAA